MDENAVKTASRGDNILNTKWMSIFPFLRTVKIDTAEGLYRFRLSSFLDSLQFLPEAVSIIVDDGNVLWTTNALTDYVKDIYFQSGWSISMREFDEKQDGGLLIESNRLKVCVVLNATLFFAAISLVSTGFSVAEFIASGVHQIEYSRLFQHEFHGTFWVDSE